MEKRGVKGDFRSASMGNGLSDVHMIGRRFFLKESLSLSREKDFLFT